VRPFIASAGCLAYLAVSGCAPHWARPDSGAAWADQDEAACQQQAELLTSPQSGLFYGSLMDLYGQNYRPAGRRQPQWMGSPGPMFDIDPARRTLEEDRLTEDCMRAKGYTPVN
jgi:hypothetical protein